MPSDEHAVPVTYNGEIVGSAMVKSTGEVLMQMKEGTPPMEILNDGVSLSFGLLREIDVTPIPQEPLLNPRYMNYPPEPD